MNEPDFEISVGLRASRLFMHVVPDALIREIGDAVTFTRREARSGLPNPPERGQLYAGVEIQKHAAAVAKSESTALPDNQPRSGGVAHDG